MSMVCRLLSLKHELEARRHGIDRLANTLSRIKSTDDESPDKKIMASMKKLWKNVRDAPQLPGVDPRAELVCDLS